MLIELGPQEEMGQRQREVVHGMIELLAQREASEGRRGHRRRGGKEMINGIVESIEDLEGGDGVGKTKDWLLEVGEDQMADGGREGPQGRHGDLSCC